MKTPDLETKMKFDYSIGTEERFAFRRWFELFIDSLNHPNEKDPAQFLSERFETYGLTPEQLDREVFVKHVIKQFKQKKVLWMRFPKLNVKKKNGIIEVRGSLEGLNKDMLVFEGEVVCMALPLDETYELTFLTFSPRLRITL